MISKIKFESQEKGEVLTGRILEHIQVPVITVTTNVYFGIPFKTERIVYEPGCVVLIDKTLRIEHILLTDIIELQLIKEW